MRAVLPVTLCCIGSATAGVPAGLQSALQEIAEHESTKWNCSVSIAFHNADGDATAAAGVINPKTGKKASVDDVYIWGSVTKVLTGSSILKLMSEGNFGLDDKIAPLVDAYIQKMASQPGWNYTWKSIGDLWGDKNVSTTTFRELLSMRSQVPDFDTANPCYTHDPKCVPKDALRASLYAHPSQGEGPLALMNVPWVSQWNGPCKGYRPGTIPMCYSSTNFMLLGLILASHAGVDSWDKLDQGMYLPDSLKAEFKFAKHITDTPSTFSTVHGIDRTHYNVPKGQVNGNDNFDVAGVFSGWTASDITGTPSAIAKLGWEVWGPSPTMLPKEWSNKMIPSQPPAEDSSYGLATHNIGRFGGGFGNKISWPGGADGGNKPTYGVAYGHLGATYGYQSIVVYFPRLNVVISVATSIETDDQQQPQDALCLAYNKAADLLLGLKDRNCTFTTGSYYNGGCKCDTPIPDDL